MAQNLSYGTGNTLSTQKGAWMSDVVSTTPRCFTSVFQRLMTIHWWMAAAYLLLYFGGVVMARLPRTPIRNTMYDVLDILPSLRRAQDGDSIVADEGSCFNTAIHDSGLL